MIIRHRSRILVGWHNKVCSAVKSPFQLDNEQYCLNSPREMVDNQWGSMDPVVTILNCLMVPSCSHVLDGIL